MADSHPDAETLARYVRGALGRGESRALEEHLAGCLSCQAAVEEIPAAAGAVVHWAGHRFAGRTEPRLSPEEEARRARLRESLAELGGVLGTLGEGFAARLLSESEHGRRSMIRGDRRFQSAAVCASLLARCREAWFDDPLVAVELAKLAVAVAGHLEPDGIAGPAASAWKALAWMHLGNAYRILSGAPATVAAEVAEPPPSNPFAGDAPAGGQSSETPVRWEEAEAALREVGDAFLTKGLHVEAALVALELATACLHRGGRAEIGPAAEQTAARLEEAGAGPEAPGALRRLRDAAASGELTAAWLEEAATTLRRSRDDPGRQPR